MSFEPTKTWTDPRAFLAAFQARLARAPNSDRVLLRSAGRAPSGWIAITSGDASDLASVALAFEPGSQVLVSSGRPRPLESCLEELGDRGFEIPGIFGFLENARLSADWFRKRDMGKFELKRELVHMELPEAVGLPRSSSDFRRARTEDLAWVFESFRQAEEEEGRLRRGVSEQEVWDRILGKEIFLLEPKGVSVSSGSLVLEDLGETGYLSDLMTRVEFRRRGFGMALTAALSQMARESGKVPRLAVASENRAAIACYRRLGFQEACRMGNFRKETSA